jgi:hypothetical protein
MPFPPPPGSFAIDFHGIDLIRGRDCIVLSKGPAHNIAVDEAMIAGGWVGGQGVQWVAANVDEPTVTYSGGLFGGFLIWGSNESADQYTAMTGNQPLYGHAVMMAGRSIISTSAYERYTYASRTGGGPLVPLVYHPQDALYFSLRGLWTNEDELSLSGSPLAPAVLTGFVCQLPKPVNQFYLGIHTRL